MWHLQIANIIFERLYLKETEVNYCWRRGALYKIFLCHFLCKEETDSEVFCTLWKLFLKYLKLKNFSIPHCVLNTNEHMYLLILVLSKKKFLLPNCKQFSDRPITAIVISYFPSNYTFCRKLIIPNFVLRDRKSRQFMLTEVQN